MVLGPVLCINFSTNYLDRFLVRLNFPQVFHRFGVGMEPRTMLRSILSFGALNNSTIRFHSTRTSCSGLKTPKWRSKAGSNLHKRGYRLNGLFSSSCRSSCLLVYRPFSEDMGGCHSRWTPTAASRLSKYCPRPLGVEFVGAAKTSYEVPAPLRNAVHVVCGPWAAELRQKGQRLWLSGPAGGLKWW
ncbi:hypothetical protein BT67DRAFT_279635 [Trichocladium antarcticum]|uniref:Uncharacterized protein n=1 Tax=Trichocladium antarcticum TaxID=1450529 RepID=A0AAN6UMJ5_9PEZI|nr:hypothetical protein BT67DRAFT_279635 [Trichocladium antarcticum]